MSRDVTVLPSANRGAAYLKNMHFARRGGTPLSLAGWTLSAAFKRANHAEAEFTLAIVTSGQGFRLRDLGAGGNVSIAIDDDTLVAVPGTTGVVDLFADVFGTPPGGDPLWLARVQLPLLNGL